MRIRFRLPDDQSFTPELWERIGVGEGWDALQLAFDEAGAEVEDDDEIVVRFPAGHEAQVRAVVTDARSGRYGADVAAYWSSAEEVRR